MDYTYEGGSVTYTVKNGTWCKDNNSEYYSTTNTGLKAALAAGEITSGTKVVIHEPKYHAGQVLQSLNPECPEGCFVPHGQTFDTSIYTELALVFPNGILPDMRECVMVCAGQNEYITTHEHDVFSAGEFKDDCAVKHSHTIAINDPGHGHNVNDPGHDHQYQDLGHTHGVTDSGHSHGRGTQNITGSAYGIPVGADFLDDSKWPPPPSGAFSDSAVYVENVNTWGNGDGYRGLINLDAAKGWTGKSETVKTGVKINRNTSGFALYKGSTGVSVDDNITSITADCSAAGTDNDTVTRTKQFGVYFYIAF